MYEYPFDVGSHVEYSDVTYLLQWYPLPNILPVEIMLHIIAFAFDDREPW